MHLKEKVEEDTELEENESGQSLRVCEVSRYR